MESVGKQGEIKFYPAFGYTQRVGHSFVYWSATACFSDVLEFLRICCMP